MCVAAASMSVIEPTMSSKLDLFISIHGNFYEIMLKHRDCITC